MEGGGGGYGGYGGRGMRDGKGRVWECESDSESEVWRMKVVHGDGETETATSMRYAQPPRRYCHPAQRVAPFPRLHQQCHQHPSPPLYSPSPLYPRPHRQHNIQISPHLPPPLCSWVAPSSRIVFPNSDPCKHQNRLGSSIGRACDSY